MREHTIKWRLMRAATELRAAALDADFCADDADAPTDRDKYREIADKIYSKAHEIDELQKTIGIARYP